MRRRAVITGLVSLVVAPAAARAQTPHAMRKIAYLNVSTIGTTSTILPIVRPVWQRLGYVEGETVLIRSAEGDPQRLPELVTELIGLEIGALIAVGPATVRAASRSTTTTPIVAIDLETDPVRSGLATSIARPNGNVTGLFMDQSSLAGKWIELLREAVPQIETIALVWDPNTGRDQLDAAMDVARVKGIEVLVLEVRTREGHEEAFRSLGIEHRTGVVQLGSPNLSAFPASLADAALKYRLPTISFWKPHAKAGALMSYGPNLEAYFPRAVILADKILKGEKPGDLPIERPDKFELVINIKTAKALGITLPPSIMIRADEVIE
jgi:putative tryptophan/tyrosine transport system substrate-binding protein